MKERARHDGLAGSSGGATEANAGASTADRGTTESGRNPFDIAVNPAAGPAFAGESGAAGQDAIVELAAGG